MTVPVLELMKAARDAVEEALNQLCIYDDTNTAANFWPAVHLGEASASLNAVIKTLEEAEEAERYEKEAEETFLRARFGPYIDDKTEPTPRKRRKNNHTNRIKIQRREHMRETPHIETIKHRLGQYLSLRMEIEIRLERLERLKSEELIPARRDDDGSQHTSPAGDKLERAIVRRMEYEARVMPEIEQRRREMKEIEDAINALPDPMERLVLQLRYTEGDNCKPLAWRDIASRIFGSYSNGCLLATYRLHGRALENIQLPICEGEKTTNF